MIVHFCSSDVNGGAALGAFALHRALLDIGVESRMFVGQKLSQEQSVDKAVSPKRTFFRRLRRRARSEFLAWDLARHRRLGSAKAPLFSDDRAVEPEMATPGIRGAEICHLHWVAGFVDHGRFFQSLPPAAALVWTLRDMNPFTGGCHYAGGCEKYRSACGSCPALGSLVARDLANRVFRRKRAAYRLLAPGNVRIVATSRWMAACARRSALFGRFDVSMIPIGVDVTAFSPRDKRVARQAFGIPDGMKVVMFVAQSLDDYRKGLDMLVAALNGLGGRQDLGLLTVGRGNIAAGLRHTHLPQGEITNQRLLSFAYCAADVFVIPSREEAFGKVVAEAVACGTPVVGFAVGGIPDVVRSGVTGLLAPPEDVRALREAIETILGDEGLRSVMAQECRRVAVEEYCLETQARRYKQIYDELLVASRAATLQAKTSSLLHRE